MGTGTPNISLCLRYRVCQFFSPRSSGERQSANDANNWEGDDLGATLLRSLDVDKIVRDSDPAGAMPLANRFTTAISRCHVHVSRNPCPHIHLRQFSAVTSNSRPVVKQNLKIGVKTEEYDTSRSSLSPLWPVFGGRGESALRVASART